MKLVKLTFRFLILLYKIKSQKYNFRVFSLKNYPISRDYYLILAGGRNVSMKAAYHCFRDIDEYPVLGVGRMRG